MIVRLHVVMVPVQLSPALVTNFITAIVVVMGTPSRRAPALSLESCKAGPLPEPFRWPTLFQGIQHKFLVELGLQLDSTRWNAWNRKDHALNSESASSRATPEHPGTPSTR